MVSPPINPPPMNDHGAIAILVFLAVLVIVAIGFKVASDEAQPPHRAELPRAVDPFARPLGVANSGEIGLHDAQVAFEADRIGLPITSAAMSDQAATRSAQK